MGGRTNLKTMATNAKPFIGKTLCVVGNGPSLLRCGLGKAIDSHDHVWRINNYQTEGFEDDVGMKTTGWVTTLYHNIETRGRLRDSVEMLVLPLNQWPIGGWKGPKILMEKMAREKGIRFVCPRREMIEEIRLELHGHAASSGITAVAMAIEMGAAVSVCGFDSFANPNGHHYFGLADRRPNGCPHKTTPERDWIMWRVATGEARNLASANPDHLVNEYRTLHEKNRSYGEGKTFVREIQEWARGRKLKTVLDYGCGKNGIAKILKSCGVKATGYDPAIPEFSTKPEDAFDGVCCLDVLEHIPADQIRTTLETISSHAKHTIFVNISTRAAVHTLPSGRNCHETVCSPGWWQRALRTFMPDFEIAHGHPRSDHYFAVLTRQRGEPLEAKRLI